MCLLATSLHFRSLYSLSSFEAYVALSYCIQSLRLKEYYVLLRGVFRCYGGWWSTSLDGIIDLNNLPHPEDHRTTVGCRIPTKRDKSDMREVLWSCNLVG